MRVEKLNDLLKKLLISIFVFFIGTWLVIAFRNFQDQRLVDIWAGFYGLILVLGIVAGIINSKQWGGFKSWLGKTIIFLSAALFLEEFGQLTFSYYNVFKHIVIPYPSIADIGFFGFIPLCLVSMISLAFTVGAKNSFKNTKSILTAIAIPPVIVLLSYEIFLKSYSSAGKTGLTVFLDLGYPLGHSLSISVLLIALVFSANKLGGVMKKRLLVFLLGITLQYAAEFNFIYQNAHLTWVSGRYGDILYLLAYAVEAYALIILVNPLRINSKTESKAPQKVEDGNE